MWMEIHDKQFSQFSHIYSHWGSFTFEILAFPNHLSTCINGLRILCKGTQLQIYAWCRVTCDWKWPLHQLDCVICVWNAIIRGSLMFTDSPTCRHVQPRVPASIRRTSRCSAAVIGQFHCLPGGWGSGQSHHRSPRTGWDNLPLRTEAWLQVRLVIDFRPVMSGPRLSTDVSLSSSIDSRWAERGRIPILYRLRHLTSPCSFSTISATCHGKHGNDTTSCSNQTTFFESWSISTATAGMLIR